MLAGSLFCMRTTGSGSSQHLIRSNDDFKNIYFRLMRVDRDITFFFKLIKLVLKQASSHKCRNSQFSYLIFTILILNLYSIF